MDDPMLNLLRPEIWDEPGGLWFKEEVGVAFTRSGARGGPGTEIRCSSSRTIGWGLLLASRCLSIERGNRYKSRAVLR